MTKVVINTEDEFELSVRQIYEYLEIKGYTNIKFVISSTSNFNDTQEVLYEDLDEDWLCNSINDCYDTMELIDIKYDNKTFNEWDLKRDDPILIDVVNLYPNDIPNNKIIEIPDDVKWHICCVDWGGEWIAENHRTWR